ncbi:hypothetical protein N1037_02815 [Phaeobacter sp. G2]|jgi:hypothetical protein|nr:hypothetical protein N1037_02815 [Phaeobacter sp. G2]
MLNIYDVHKMPRILPEHLENIMSERDKVLNRFPPAKILEIFQEGEARIFVDRTRALAAASRGLKVSSLSQMLVFLVPIFAIASIPAFIFVSWKIGLLCFLGAVIAFRAGRSLTIADVRKAAISDPKVLRTLMENGVVWFRTEPGHAGEAS